MNKSCWYGKSHCGERTVIRCNLNSTIWFSKFAIHPYFDWGEDFYGYVSYNTWTRISFGWWCFGALFPQNTSQCYVAKRDISDIRLNQDWIRYLEIHCSQERECFIRIHNFFVEICLYSFRQRCSLNASATKIQDKSRRMKPLPFIILTWRVHSAGCRTLHRMRICLCLLGGCNFVEHDDT